MQTELKEKTKQMLDSLLKRYHKLIPLRETMIQAVVTLKAAFQNGHKLLLCGNGGSSADCDHIAGELLKGFLKKRPISGTLREKLTEMYGEEGKRIAGCLQQGLPVISLCSHTAAISAVANDMDAAFVFAQQVLAYGREGDVLLAISTSGNAENVNTAVKTAKALGMFVIALTGQPGGQLARNADLVLAAPDTETNRIQEYHLPIYHLLCAAVEEELFDK